MANGFGYEGLGADSDEWVPTEAALTLGTAYRQDPTGIHWQQMLGEQLGRYEPRVRVLLYLLGHGHELRFETHSFFGGNSERATLTGDVPFHLFDNEGAAFNTLLTEHAEVAVGPWWREEIMCADFELADRWRLEGAMNRPPSTNKISSALKIGLYVFKALDILVEQDGSWRLEPSAFARHLSADLTQDLVGDSGIKLGTSDEWHRLVEVISASADSQGFVIVSEAAERWGELSGVPISERATDFDRLVGRGHR